MEASDGKMVGSERGDPVLDVCCGSVTSRRDFNRVGEEGTVFGLILENQLRRAAEKLEESASHE